MKKILFLMIAIFIFGGCSKDNEGNPLTERITEEQGIYNAILKATTDTVGLKLVGTGTAYYINDTSYSICNESFFALGRKNQKMWCGFFDRTDEFSFIEKYSLIFKENFNDTIRIVDKGHGNIDTLKLGFCDHFFETCGVYVTDQNTFIVINPISHIIFVNEGNVYFSDYYIQSAFNGGVGIWRDYYLLHINTGVSSHEFWVFNKKGEKIYKAVDSAFGKTAVDLYNYIDLQVNKNTYIATLYNAQSGSIIWQTEIRNLGKIIDDNNPKISEKHIVNNTYITCTFDITNYDGSKEEKIIKLNIEDGALVDK